MVSHVIIGRPSGFSGIGTVGIDVSVGVSIGERTPSGKCIGACAWVDFFCFNKWTI